jgi:hypothetical protein
VSCCSCGRYDAARTARAVRWRSRRRVSVVGVGPVARPACGNERDHCAHFGRGYPFPDVRNRSGRIHDGRNRARPAPRADRAPSGSRRAAPAPESGPPPARRAGPARPESGAPHEGAGRSPAAYRAGADQSPAAYRDDAERHPAACRAGAERCPAGRRAGAVPDPRAAPAGARRRRGAARCGKRRVCGAEQDERWRGSGTAREEPRSRSAARPATHRASRSRARLRRVLPGRPAWAGACFGRTRVVVMVKEKSTVTEREPDRWARAAPDRRRVAGGMAPPWPPDDRRR